MKMWKHRWVAPQDVIDLAKTITPADVTTFLEDHGDVDYYLDEQWRNTQRLGQRFYNALNDEWCELLHDTPQDPYYSDVEYSVALAVAWLTAQEIANEEASLQTRGAS